MQIYIHGLKWDGESPFPRLVADGVPYSEVSRQVITVRPVSFPDLPAGMDSGRIDGRSGLARPLYDLPVMHDGKWAEFKTTTEALSFAETLDLEAVSIDYDTIGVLIPELDA